jgi:histone deacetylase 6
MHTARAAFLSAGGAVEAIRALCDPNQVTPVDSVFAIVRPPGHHAHCSSNAGFCFFNNVAVAARVAQKEFNKKKVCIFDWDVHVGDGTS